MDSACSGIYHYVSFGLSGQGVSHAYQYTATFMRGLYEKAERFARRKDAVRNFGSKGAHGLRSSSFPFPPIQTHNHLVHTHPLIILLTLSPIHTDMSEVTDLEGRLAGMGFPSDPFSSLTQNLNLIDILSVAIRFALIGLLAAGVKALFHVIKSYIFDGECCCQCGTQAQLRLTAVLFPTAYIPATDPAFEWVMAFMAQHEGVQKQLRSFRLSTTDSRNSQRDDVHRNNPFMMQDGLAVLKKQAVPKTQANFMLGDVVGQVIPINGEYMLRARSTDLLSLHTAYVQNEASSSITTVRGCGLKDASSNLQSLPVSETSIIFVSRE